jgi:hypothetical protein
MPSRRATVVAAAQACPADGQRCPASTRNASRVVPARATAPDMALSVSLYSRVPVFQTNHLILHCNKKTITNS